MEDKTPVTNSVEVVKRVPWGDEYDAWLKVYVRKHGLTNAENASPKMIWEFGFWEAAHLIKEQIPVIERIATEKENLRCQEVLARIMWELGMDNVTLEQLQRAVALSLIGAELATQPTTPNVNGASSPSPTIEEKNE